MLCIKCMTRINFGATVCPNCTRDIAGSGAGDNAGFLGLVLICIIMGIGSCTGLLK